MGGLQSVCMHPFAMATVAILVHRLNKFLFCTKMAIMAVAKLLLWSTSYVHVIVDNNHIIVLVCLFVRTHAQ